MEIKGKGFERFKEVVGEEVLPALQAASPDFAKLVVDFVYGDLFLREGINDKTREVAIVACLVGQGNTGAPLKTHLKGMLNVGWTPAEIIEVLILLSAFRGFPSALESLSIFSEVIKAQK